MGSTLFGKFFKAAALAPLFALYAFWRLLAGCVAGAREIARTRRLLADTMRCPSCGFDNPLVGRWTCANCQAVYHGFVGCCGVCGAGASMFSCERCEVSLVLEPHR